MATTRTFQDMLNEYLPNSLLYEELVKRDYFLKKISKDEDWRGGDIIVPFRGAQASSIKFGSLTAANDIAESKFVRGKIQQYREVWGSLIFNSTDLMQHQGAKITEETFLKILPDEIDNFMDNMKEVVSYQFGCGPHMAKVTDATNAATGIMIVDRVDRFIIGQKLLIDDNDSAVLPVYVTNINVNTSAVTFSATRGGSAVDLSAYTVAQNARFFYDGVWDGTNADTFISIRSALLSAANGGSTTLHGQSKLAYPYLQAVNINGGVGGLAISATNILEKLFEAYLQVRIKARGKADTLVMSYKHWGSVMKAMQTEKGAYVVTENPLKSQYGWYETTIATTTTGEALKVVGVQEMDDDVIFIMDFSSLKFRSNGGFKKHQDANGNNFYIQRGTSGYQYIIDCCLFGELEHTKPSNNGIIYGISYT